MINGVMLLARGLLAESIAKVRKDYPEADIKSFQAGLARVEVTSTPYQSDMERLIAAWKETTINSKLNQKLNPIMQVKSIISAHVDPDAAQAQFEKQISMIDPKLRPQGKSRQRIKHFNSKATWPHSTFCFMQSSWFNLNELFS